MARQRGGVGKRQGRMERALTHTRANAQQQTEPRQNRWEAAIAIFQRALTLPGTGVKRFRDRPRMISDGAYCGVIGMISDWTGLTDWAGGWSSLNPPLWDVHDDRGQPHVSSCQNAKHASTPTKHMRASKRQQRQQQHQARRWRRSTTRRAATRASARAARACSRCRVRTELRGRAGWRELRGERGDRGRRFCCRRHSAAAPAPMPPPHSHPRPPSHQNRRHIHNHNRNHNHKRQRASRRATPTLTRSRATPIWSCCGRTRASRCVWWTALLPDCLAGLLCGTVLLREGGGAAGGARACAGPVCIASPLLLPYSNPSPPPPGRPPSSTLPAPKTPRPHHTSRSKSCSASSRAAAASSASSCRGDRRWTVGDPNRRPWRPPF